MPEDGLNVHWAPVGLNCWLAGGFWVRTGFSKPELRIAFAGGLPVNASWMFVASCAWLLRIRIRAFVPPWAATTVPGGMPCPETYAPICPATGSGLSICQYFCGVVRVTMVCPA